MKAQDISPGMTVTLKPSNPYGLSGAYTVNHLHYRPGYKTPLVACDSRLGCGMIRVLQAERAALMSSPTFHRCALCGRRDRAETMVYSRFTRNRYCGDDLAACERRAKRHRANHPADTPSDHPAMNFEPRYHVPRSQVWEGSRGRQSGNVHLHALEPVTLGRIHREPGRSLCGRDGWYEREPYPTETHDICPRCAEIAARAEND